MSCVRSVCVRLLVAARTVLTIEGLRAMQSPTLNLSRTFLIMIMTGDTYAACNPHTLTRESCRTHAQGTSPTHFAHTSWHTGVCGSISGVVCHPRLRCCLSGSPRSPLKGGPAFLRHLEHTGRRDGSARLGLQLGLACACQRTRGSVPISLFLLRSRSLLLSPSLSLARSRAHSYCTSAHLGVRPCERASKGGCLCAR